MRHVGFMPALGLIAALAVACGGQTAPAQPPTQPSIALAVASPTATPTPTAAAPDSTATATPSPTATTGTSVQSPAPISATPTPTLTGQTPAGQEAHGSAQAAPDVGSPATQPPPYADPRLEGCVSDPSPTFANHYTDLSQIDFINPTIVTSGNWLKNRQYHKVVTDAGNNAPLVPLYAPTDAVAIEVTHYRAMMQPWVGEPFLLSQFDVRFQATCEVRYWFDHISQLAEPFASLAPAEGSLTTQDAAVAINVEVKAGDIIGWSSGTEPAHVWDFVIVNTAKTSTFANQARYEGTGNLGHILHTDCPSSYMSDEMRATHEAKFASWQGKLDGYECQPSVDVLGALTGGWFQTPYNGSLAFPPADWGLVAKIAADGYVDVNGPSFNIRTAPSHATFADPDAVTGEHCFEDRKGQGHVYVKLLSDVELAAASGSGSCPASLPAGAQTFYR